MTIEEYARKRKWQDRKNRKEWENALLGFITLMVLVCTGIGLLGLVMSVLG